MTPARYRRITEIFQAALEVSPTERAAFLANECEGDTDLLTEVESLIASHEADSEFLNAPALAVFAEKLAETETNEFIGQTVGRYKIVSLLGSGGMGQVYLGEDIELGRRVALKFLPEYFTHDRDQVRRFRQEARAASALNHPNILTVYEIGQFKQTEFIATEYIEGQTLRERLNKPHMNTLEVLDVSVQITAALVAAHDAGIIHRDIKPENVMIRRDGYVKVLDFGLAKLTENLRPAEFDAPTRPAIKTNPGVVMGTAEYMSPEQARGLPVDTRTDVWSLGVVMYEMLAKRRPFSGPTYTDTVVAILQREPPSLNLYDREIPAELEAIVLKTLAKNREDRYQAAKDLETELRALRRRLEVDAELQSSPREDGPMEAVTRLVHPTTDPLQGPSNVVEFPRTTSSVEYIVTEIQKHKRGALITASVAIVLLGMLGFFVLKFLSTRQPKAGPFQATTLTRITSSGNARIAAISPDGKYVVYSAEENKQRRLWVKQIATGSTVQVLPPTAFGYWGLTFSNDSNYVYFVRNGESGSYNQLYQIPSLGGPVKKLMDQVDSSIAFSPDGRHFAFVRDDLQKSETSIIVATSDGKNERRLAVRTAPDRFESDFATRIGWSPDGNMLACAASSTDAHGYYATVVGVSAIDGSEKSLTTQRWAFTGQVVWLKDSQGLVMVAAEQGRSRTAAQLWHVSYPTGEARRITNDLNRYVDVSLTADSRSLITVQSNRISDIWVAPSRDLTQAKQITTGAVEGFGGVNWTPDGRIVYLSRVSGKSDVWIMNADGSGQKQLTYEGQNVRPIVSTDGHFILFSSNREGRTNVWRMDIDGNNARQLTQGGTNSNAYPAPDGRSAIYVSQDAGNGTLWTIPVDGGQATRLSNPTVNLPVVSPDGKQIACYYWDEQANPPRGVMVMPFEGGSATRRFRIDSNSDSFVLYWTSDSKAILYISNITNIWSQPLDGGAPKQVTDLQGDQLFNFNYSSDGKWLALVRGRVINDVVLISDGQN